MKKPKQSEKIFLENVIKKAHDLKQKQQGVEIGQLLTLIRNQLRMSQRALAIRAKVPQSTISNIESGRLQPNISTLKKILRSLECDLIISAAPREKFEAIRRKQAEIKAKKAIEYLGGTMSLEAQRPSQELLEGLLEEKVNDLLNASGRELWEEGL